MSAMIELKRSIPVVGDVDVLVAGGGIAGSTAAVTAARSGAQTMLIDRFGCLGGNMGPGIFSGGYGMMGYGFPSCMTEGLTGIPGEFVRRCESYLGEPLMLIQYNYCRDSQVVSYVWSKMMQESGVRLLLNAYATQPIMEGNRATGLVVENKSGGQAIRAKVVIDATGDADVAMRAGAQVDEGQGYFHPGMYFAMGDVDDQKYLAFLHQVGEPDPDDLEWAQQVFEREDGRFVPRLNPLIKFYREAWELGEYTIVGKIGDLATVTVDHGLYVPSHGIVGAQIGLQAKQKAPSGDVAVMSELESGCRRYIFQTAQFLRRHVPGFEHSYLHLISPYFASRGGRSIVSERPVTMDDFENEQRFDDVVFVASSGREKAESGFDFPYRQFLPRGVEGLLVTGRSAIIRPPTTRTRWKVLLMGQATGLAAAMAATGGVTPREVNVKELQSVLYHKFQLPLGDKGRMRELGLI